MPADTSRRSYPKRSRRNDPTARRHHGAHNPVLADMDCEPHGAGPDSRMAILKGNPAMNKGNAEKEFERFHEAVFGREPTLKKIPHEILRAYLDDQTERKFLPGLFNYRVAYSKNPLNIPLTSN
jgi:hypothetical protein